MDYLRVHEDGSVSEGVNMGGPDNVSHAAKATSLVHG